MQAQANDEIKTNIEASYYRRPRLASLLAAAFGGGETVNAWGPSWPACCARCCKVSYPNLREPWCGSCARTNWAEYAAIFRSWVYENREFYLRAAGVPPKFQRCSIDNFEARNADQRRAISTVAEWCTGGSCGLFLHGAVGTGKTHLATAALLEKLTARKRCRFVAARDFIRECRESFRLDALVSQIIDKLTDGPDFLLLDDLGAEKPTEFSREVFESLIDRAYVEQRPRLIVTSNLDIDGLSRTIGERIADRLRELCIVLRLGAGSYRRRIAARRAGVGEGASNL